MSTNYIGNSDKSRGQRHKMFRKEVLGLTQIQLQEWLKEKGIEKSQASISNYDSGVIPSEDILLIYAENGMNLHWYFTGVGGMIQREGIGMAAESEGAYNAIKNSFKLKFSDDPISEMFNAMDKLKQEYIKVLSSKSLSDDELADLKTLVIDKAIEKVEHLKEIR